VCVPFKDEVTGVDSFWLAKVRESNHLDCLSEFSWQVLSSDHAEVALIELAPTEITGQYRSDLRSVWREPVTACYLCDADFEEAKNVYFLRTSSSEITGLLKEVDE